MMTGRATITFSQPGVQPPVYVVTSLSSPPWDTLELHAEQDQEKGGDLVFERSFENVVEGTYQYKIRTGEGHWVVDESKETATDEHGNRNNVVHTHSLKNAKSPESTSQPGAEPAKTVLQPVVTKPEDPPLSTRKDSTISDTDASTPLRSEPSLSAVVKNISEQKQPESGATNLDTAVKDEPPRSPEVPLIIVEKTDDKPVHGDDLGKDASPGQKAAHEMRTADAEPDKVVIVPDDDDLIIGGELEATSLLRHETPNTTGELDIAPLLSHETTPAKDTSTPPSMNTIHEVSTESSNAGDTVSQQSEITKDNNESTEAPLLSHEMNSVEHDDAAGESPLRSHELEADDDADELNHGPLLSHETELNGADNDGRDELDAAPLLSHESGFSSRSKSIATSNSGYSRDEEDSESRGFAYDDDDDDLDYDDDPENDAPLLPHERDSNSSSQPSSDAGDHLSLHYQTSFGNSTDVAKDLFGQSTTFRTRTNSSTLPHRMPRSDAEDENLHDPSLERFPIGRANILERVASIGLQLPEDQTIEEIIHSPVQSVFSTSASSVENLSTLAPVKSYSSLASVPEGDSDDDEAADVESLPSPVLLNFPKTSSAFAHEGIETPRSEDNKRLGYTEVQTSQTPSDGASDPATDGSFAKGNLKESISDKANDVAGKAADALEPITSSHPAPMADTSTSRESDSSNTESKMRQRNVTQDKGIASPDSTSKPNDAAATNLTRSVYPPQPPPSQPQLQTNKHPESLLQSFIRVVLGPIGQFLTACIGGRNKSGIAALAIGVLGVVWWAFG